MVLGDGLGTVRPSPAWRFKTYNYKKCLHFCFLNLLQRGTKSKAKAQAEVMKMMNRIIGITTVLLTASGCATMRDSILLGAGSGVAAGAATGALTSSEDKGKGALIGAAIGAVVGGATAYFVHGGLEKRDAQNRKDTLFGLEKFGVSSIPHQNSSVPAISFPITEEQKIETHRQGNKVIEGHRVWIMSDDSNIKVNEKASGHKEDE
jgi:hypothetical protein